MVSALLFFDFLHKQNSINIRKIMEVFCANFRLFKKRVENAINLFKNTKKYDTI